MTVFANVAYPLHCRGMPKADVAGRVASVLEMVGVGGLGEQFPGRISGGQQQRVALARALVASSTVVLFDEPLSNVDAQVRAQLRFELKSMQQRIGFSGLYVTHDQIEAMELGHRVAVLEAGRIAALGRPREIYESPNSEYVASFVGTANIWPGRIAGLDDTVVRIATDFGVLQATRAHLRGDAGMLQEGKPISVVVRPEKMRLSRTPPQDTPNCVPVRIEAAMFAGAHTEIVVSCGPAQARIWSHDDDLGELARGEDAWVAVSPDNVRIVPASPGAGGRTP
jgi:ABC-type Fe3+/spermidine/putrescine transport system ATPase subunit